MRCIGEHTNSIYSCLSSLRDCPCEKFIREIIFFSHDKYYSLTATIPFKNKHKNSRNKRTTSQQQNNNKNFVKHCKQNRNKTDKKADRRTDRQRDRQTDIKADRQTDRHRDRKKTIAGMYRNSRERFSASLIEKNSPTHASSTITSARISSDDINNYCNFDAYSPQIFLESPQSELLFDPFATIFVDSCCSEGFFPQNKIHRKEEKEEDDDEEVGGAWMDVNDDVHDISREVDCTRDLVHGRYEDDLDGLLGMDANEVFDPLQTIVDDDVCCQVHIHNERVNDFHDQAFASYSNNLNNYKNDVDDDDRCDDSNLEMETQSDQVRSDAADNEECYVEQMPNCDSNYSSSLDDEKNSSIKESPLTSNSPLTSPETVMTSSSTSSQHSNTSGQSSDNGIELIDLKSEAVLTKWFAKKVQTDGGVSSGENKLTEVREKINVTAKTGTMSWFSRVLPDFGKYFPTVSSGIRRLESFIPKISLDVENVVDCEKQLEIGTEDFNSIRKFKKLFEDCLFNNRSRDVNGKNADENYFPVNSNETEALKLQNGNKIVNGDSKTMFKKSPKRSVFQSLTQQLSFTRFSSDKEENVGSGFSNDVQVTFQNEQVNIAIIDECFVDLGRFSINLAYKKLWTKIYSQFFLNSPFKLTIALNDRRRLKNNASPSSTSKQFKEKNDKSTSEESYDLLNFSQIFEEDDDNNVDDPLSERFVTVRDVVTNLPYVSNEYSAKRELKVQTFGIKKDNKIIGRKIELARLKIFSPSAKNIQNENLPLQVAVHMLSRHNAKIRLHIELIPRLQCTGTVVRLPVAQSWMELLKKMRCSRNASSKHRVGGSSAGVAVTGFEKLQVFLNSHERTDVNFLEVTCGEAWFCESDEQINWFVGSLTQQNEAALATILQTLPFTPQ
ncbi:hypothetical protein HELRODRAFT_159511 [Helobdella robusta]|uniref:Uncharacterized protein n=1 Tax=Helobdella robusta TaxID=6412 RepID=T1EP42_HELRO|nr:hypothetical protein HELRODRAFT_159511 [Helobdella robusta]ESO12923.1 hypothetical protein HELRODRAFT_159511 [Helobdella robusta]